MIRLAMLLGLVACASTRLASPSPCERPMCVAESLVPAGDCRELDDGKLLCQGAYVIDCGGPEVQP